MTEPGDGFVLAVDLGTSHTVAMLRRPDGRTRPLLFDGQPLLPSAVYLDADRRLHVGRDAQRLGYADPARIEPHPKRRVDEDAVHLGDAAVPVADLLAALLGAVAREAVATAGFLPPAVLTYPAAWGSTRRGVLIEALGRAGWPATTRLVPEPVAAARYFADVLRRPVPVGAALAVFDLGGGTLDVAVVRNGGLGSDGRPRFEVAASGGADDLGGLDLDAALVDHVGRALSAAEPEAWDALTDPRTLAQWRARRQFWEDVRGAKEMLSRSSVAPVTVPGVEQAVPLTRAELEATAGPLIRRGVAEAAAVIEAAGVGPAELAGLFLVGGSSRVPLVARLLHAELGVAPTVLEQPELPVAEGAIVALPSDATGTPEAASAAPPAVQAAQPATAPQAVASASAVAEVGGAAGLAEAGAAAGPAEVGGAAGPAEVGGAAGSVEVGGAAGPAGLAAAAGDGADGGGTQADHRGWDTGTAALVPDDQLTYRRGVAEAATPTPTPTTIPAQGQVDGGSPAYAEPVDPWATGEAAAFGTSGPPAYNGSAGEGGHGGGGPVPTGAHGGAGMPWLASEEHAGRKAGVPWLASEERAGGKAGGPAYRKKWVWLVALVAVVVVAAVATVGRLLWPGYRAIEFQALDKAAPVTLDAATKFSSNLTESVIYGDRVYWATESDDGALGIVAADAGNGTKVWGNTAAGIAGGWEQIIGLPDGVAAISDVDSTSGQRRIVVLDGDSGRVRWQRAMDRDDTVRFSGPNAVFAESRNKRLLALRRSDGEKAWETPDPKVDSTTTPVVWTSQSADDLGGPARASGVPFAPDYEDDTRLLQVLGDRSARVIDAADGSVEVGPKAGIADTDGLISVTDDRVVTVETTGTTQRVLSFNLSTLENPKVLGQAENGARIMTLAPCGRDHVCWIESTSYDAKTNKLAGVRVDDGARTWRVSLPEAETIVPVGDHALVTQNLSPTPKVALVDAATGKVSWTADGAAGRLDGGNVLLFSRGLSTSPEDPSLAGRHLGDDPVQLGPLPGVRTASCSWNTEAIACVADATLIWQRIAA